MAKKKGKPPMPPDTPLAAAAARRHELTRARAIQALRELDREGTPVTFAAVAAAAGISRSWLYTQPDIRTQLEQLRKAAQDAPGPTIPASQRASDPSLRSRLATALQRNRALAGENARLRRQLARTLGDQRSAQPQSGNDQPRLNRHNPTTAASSKTPSTTRHRRSKPRPGRGLKIRLGTTGGFGILVLLALTAVAVVAFFARDHRGRERLAPADRPRAGRRVAGRHRRAGHAALRHAARRPARRARRLGAAGQLCGDRRARVAWGLRAEAPPARTSTRRSGSVRTPSPASSPRPPTGPRRDRPEPLPRRRRPGS